MLRNVAVALGLCGSLLACQDTSNEKVNKTSFLKKAWDSLNNPGQMEDYVTQQRYKTVFSELPLEGKLKKLPWTDDYWATFRGGISYRWNSEASDEERVGYNLLTEKEVLALSLEDLKKLSPAEKFDIYLGKFQDSLPDNEKFPFTRKERHRTKVLKTIPGNPRFDPDYVIPTWEGLCHAWAPATLAFSEPGPIIEESQYGKIQVPFGSSDLKALLTYFLHETESETYFLGARCEFDLADLKKQYINKEISYEYYSEQRNACDDTNAGALHIVLANQIGLLNEGFVGDFTREAEVWNQAVYAFDSKVISKFRGASPGAAPGTVEEYTMKTHVQYTAEIEPTYEKPTFYPNKHATYNYRLEIDRSGRIIGGEYLTEDSDRPDFLWKQHVPRFRGIYKHLAYLYYKSIGQQVPAAQLMSTVSTK